MIECPEPYMFSPEIKKKLRILRPTNMIIDMDDVYTLLFSYDFFHHMINLYIIRNIPVILGRHPCSLTHFKWKMIACTKR
jgi:hypothetical protein